MPKNKLHVVLHGHFYQPPREDPWTHEIEKQPSANPFHDWNERINKECYAANAASRVLDASGRIEDIVNNYQYLSFNFGPTLINWLKKYDPKTFELIVQADKESVALNNGHGNAIAQVYNHIIMPLASDRDAITQIEWGIKSFQKDFGRDPEGIWLAETAINEHIAEFLVSYGIKFVILSPTQAKEVRPVNAGHDQSWKDVSNNTIDPSRPYRLQVSNGSLGVFFYYGTIAAKMSFEHLLRNVDFIRGELLASNNQDKETYLVHVATDGENYGHHEPFGDMCLARLFYENRTQKDFIFTNYGNYLEICPPQEFVRLKEGNDGLGTAWSCAHGVDRWRRDCGDSTGGQAGWNQKWREGLRNAFDLLRDKLHASAEKELGKFCRENIWAARNDFVEVVVAGDGEERDNALAAFYAKHFVESITDSDRVFILRIMEALHNALLMYTSCGWFFSEISGIETVQDMRYAARVFDLAGEILNPETKAKFLDILNDAKSNIAEFQHGRRVYEMFVEKRAFSVNHVINEYLLSAILTRESILFNQTDAVYFYRIRINNCQIFSKENWQIYKFRLNVKNTHLKEDDQYIVYIFRNDDNFKTFIKKTLDDTLTSYLDKLVEKDNPKLILKDFNEWFNVNYSLYDLNYDTKEKLLSKLFEKSMQVLHRKISCDDMNVDRYLDIISLYEELGVAIPDHDMIAIKELLSNYIICQLEQFETIDLSTYNFSKMIKIIQTAKKSHFNINYTEILPFLRNYVLKRMNHAILDFDTRELENLEKVIDFTNIAGIDFEKYEIQNLLFDQLMKMTVAEMPFMNKYTINILLKIASKFNISIHQFEVKLRAKFL